MSVRTLLFRQNVARNIRTQAWLNVACAVYMWSMTLAMTHIAFFIIIPECYEGSNGLIFSHRLFIWYVFSSVIGNYVTCIETDTKPKVLSKKTKESKFQQTTGTSEVTQRNKPTSPAVESKGRYCLPCDNHVPPRTHHCFLCEKCVIRRDHHCFFMGVCIGQTNHVYFILFTLYMGIGTFYGMLMVAKYMHFQYSIQCYGPQTFITLFLGTVVSIVRGNIPSLLFLVCFVLLYVSLAGTLFAFGFFFWHIVITSRGQTTFEARRGIKKFSKNSIVANMKQIIKKNWILSTFIPFWDYTMNAN
ncbi:hypothetical protein ACF0H5_003682 [Mactra antiquata]